MDRLPVRFVHRTEKLPAAGPFTSTTSKTSNTYLPPVAWKVSAPPSAPSPKGGFGIHLAWKGSVHPSASSPKGGFSSPSLAKVVDNKSKPRSQATSPSTTSSVVPEKFAEKSGIQKKLVIPSIVFKSYAAKAKEIQALAYEMEPKAGCQKDENPSAYRPKGAAG